MSWKPTPKNARPAFINTQIGHLEKLKAALEQQVSEWEAKKAQAQAELDRLPQK